jgi:hypothetical protein
LSKPWIYFVWNRGCRYKKTNPLWTIKIHTPRQANNYQWVVFQAPFIAFNVDSVKYWDNNQ